MSTGPYDPLIICLRELDRAGYVRRQRLSVVNAIMGA
jgi:hypothetical protein